MATVEEKLNYLNETKEAIKQAIIDKGGVVTDTDTFRSYAEKIGELKTAGENKLAKVIDKTIENIESGDLEGATSIGLSAFNSCINLKSVIIPSSVTTLAERAFVGCSSLTEIEIPSSVTSIGTYAFSGSGLTNITIPSSVTSIGGSAFHNCKNLTKVVYEGQAPSISSYTFNNSTRINLYNFSNCTTVPTLASTNSLSYASGCKIVVPDSLYDSWTTATQWVKLTNVVWVKASEYVEA